MHNEFLAKVFNIKKLEYFNFKLDITPTLVFAGASGSGKTTAASKFANKVVGKIIKLGNNIIQSTKVKNKLIPLIGVDTEDAVIEIAFRNPTQDLLKESFIAALQDEFITRKVKIDITDGKIMNEVIDSVYHNFLTPKSFSFDLSSDKTSLKLSNQIKFMIEEDFKKVIKKYIERLMNKGDKDDFYLKINRLTDQAKAKDNKNFRKVEAIKEIFNEKINSILESEKSDNLECKDLGENELFLKMIGLFEQDIRDEFKNLAEAGVECVEEKGNDGLTHYFIRIAADIFDNREKETEANVIKNYFTELYKPTAKETVLAYIAYYCKTPVHTILEEKENDISKGEAFPIFTLYDLKGIESLNEDEVMNEISECKPDHIIIFRRLTDVKEITNKIELAIKSQYKNMPISYVDTHLDEAIKKSIINIFNKYDVNKELYEIDAEDINDMENDKEKELECLGIAESYVEVMTNSCIFKDVDKKESEVNNIAITTVGDYNRALDKIIFSNAFSDSINTGIKAVSTSNKYTRNRIYDDKVLVTFILAIYIHWYNSMEHLQQDVKNNLKGCNVFAYENEHGTAINTLAKKCVENYKKVREKEILHYMDSTPHWASVYTWRFKNRYGYGHTTDSQIFDNFSIYIGAMAMNFISSEDLRNLYTPIVQNVDGSVNKSDDAHKAQAAINKSYREDESSIRYFLRRKLAYEDLKEDFDKAYFASALRVIDKRFLDEKYWENAIRDVAKYRFELAIQKTMD